MDASEKYVITLPDYERIFRVIHGVLLNERGDPLHACVYFSVIGSIIMREYHRIEAEPVFGMAAYRLDGNVVIYAKRDGNKYYAASNGFHSWIEADGVAVDFQAPLFKDYVANQSPSVSLPRKMMQKRLDQASLSVGELAASGTHLYRRDDNLRSHLLAEFIQKKVNSDLINICLDWYKPAPGKIADHIEIGNQHGHVSRVPLSPLRISGAW